MCNAKQFNNIAANYQKDPLVSIFLLKDIDFAHGLFVPIGDDLNSNKSASTPFEGIFYGGNFKLKNIDFHMANISEMGIFRHLDGALIRDLKIFKSAIESHSTNSAMTEKIGLIAGVTTNSPSVFKNITADKIHISGGKNIGGLIGLANGSVELQKVQLKGSIEGRQDAIGGLIGEIRSTSATIQQSSFDGLSITREGKYAGGLIGKISNVQSHLEINQSFVKGYVKAKSYVGGLVGGIFTDDSIPINPVISDSYVQAAIVSSDLVRPYAGGLVGYSQADNAGNIDKFNISRSYMAHSYLSFDGSNAGGATGNAATCSNVFIASNKGSGCGTVKTQDQLYTQATYSAASFDFSINGSWTHPDTGHDLPHLRWEDNLNYACSGKYAGTHGSGSAADPKWVCSTTQFLNMSVGTHYILKRDLDFKNDPAASQTYTARLFAPGQYLLDGDNHSLLNITIIPEDYKPLGIFASLSTGSIIKNLKVANLKMKFTGTLTGETHFGTIVGINAGVLENISIFDSEQSIINSDINTANTHILLGGLVSENTSTGKISYSSSWTNTITEKITISSTNTVIKYGGIASINYGSIQYSQAAGLFSYKSTALAEDTSADKFLIGGLVGYNDGVIKESQVSREANFSFENTSSSAGISFGGICYFNAPTAGNISDVSVRPHLNLGNSMGDISSTFGLLAAQNHGTISRSFYIEDSFNGGSELPVAIVGSPLRLKASGNGAISDSFCSVNNISTGTCAKVDYYNLNAGTLSAIDTNGIESFSSGNYSISENFMDPNSVWSMYGLNNSGNTDEAPEVQKISEHIWKLGLNGIGGGAMISAGPPPPPPAIPGDAFVTTWQTTIANENIVLPLRAGFTYNFEVDWGDGSPRSTINSDTDPNKTHAYANAGSYTVSIWGTLEAWYFNNAGDKLKLTSVQNLGNVGWKNLGYAFYGCSLLTDFAIGNADTSLVTNMAYMFSNTNHTKKEWFL